MTKHRILTIAHAHPDFSLGGGELAAYNLFKTYQQHSAVEEAWFLARADRHRGVTGHISLRRTNEYLWEQAVIDWYGMKAAHQQSLTTWFVDLIKTIKPSIVHSHHYAHLGLEYLQVIKQIDPTIRIYLTLHEYMAICLNDGQMIKKNDFKLCSRESFDECCQCFPEKKAEDFWLRKHFFQSYFKLIDGFIAPSEFLRQRYIAWGLKPAQITVIENGQANKIPLASRPLGEYETHNRFAYFGQITPYKGLNIILEALHALAKEEREKIVLEVHGANLEHQPSVFRDKIEQLRAELIKEGIVQWVGAYQPHEISERMAGIDWVVVPSVWWENSPMVIQEAFVHGKPIICSNIGGMAEKVTHNIDGLHVPAGNIFAWKNTLRKVASDNSLWQRLQANIHAPLSHIECAERHFLIFSKV